MWDVVEALIQKIYSHDISKPEYMVLFFQVYKICTTGSAVGNDDIPLNSRRLHQELTRFFARYHMDLLKDYEGLSGEHLLCHYTQQWQDYRASSKIVDNAFAYLNKQWVRRNQKSDSVDIQEVYHLSLASWQENVLNPLKSGISSAIRKLIEKERNGETVNTGPISIALNSFVEMEINSTNSDGTEPNLSLYKDAFETDFLTDTEVFYNTESASVMHTNPLSEFMKKIEIWFQEEEKRTRLYLHKSTLDKLERILKNVMEKYIEIFYSEFKSLLECNKTDDLKRMFHLLSRIPGGLDELKLQFENYILLQGLSSIEKFTEVDSIDPKSYINAILEIYQTHNATVVVAFDSDAGFAAAMDKACEKFINKNAVTERSGSSRKSAELLAKYCDLQLKKKPSGDEEMKIIDNLNLAMIVFKYIEEKDVFQTFYSKMLAKRLIQQVNSAGNDDAETIMISKLRQACGFEYTSKLQRLFQDVSVSRDLNTNFRQSAYHPDIDFSINIISSSSWPFSQTLTCNLPKELEQSVQLFTEFYTAQHSGRKLTWLQGMSRGELVSKCFDKTYTFEASTFQMAVLLQFNSGDAFTVAQLEESTGMRSDILLQVLQSLLKVKLLNFPGDTVLSASSTVSLCTDYRHKKLKVNINAPIKSEKKSEQDSVHRGVEENRNILIQAAIVRIAKSRKVVQHNTLISEVVSQLSAQFKPKIPAIKKCIDILIEKDYLERTDNGNSYSYVA